MTSGITALTVREETTLLSFLSETKKELSPKKIKSMLTHGQITVDGVVRTKYDTALFKGQIVRIQRVGLAREPEKKLLDIIYEDEDFIVINKPSGLLTISSDNEKERTAYRMLMDYVRKGSPKNRIFIVHRLDKDTSGLVLFAKSIEIKNSLMENWDILVKYRGYLAITDGVPAKREGRLVSWLKENSIHIVYISDKEGDGKEAITNYRVIKENGKFALLEVWLETGRKNQIRVQLKDMGYPVIGDKRYGSAKNPIARLGLHAARLELINPRTGKLMKFSAKPTRKFADFIAKSAAKTPNATK